MDSFQTELQVPLAPVPFEPPARALQRYAAAFFTSPAIAPERLLLTAGTRLFEGHGQPPDTDFEAQWPPQPGAGVFSGTFRVVEATEHELLLEWGPSSGIQGLTWLSIQQAQPFAYELRFGSAVWGP